MGLNERDPEHLLRVAGISVGLSVTWFQFVEGHRPYAPGAMHEHVKMVMVGRNGQIDPQVWIGARDKSGRFHCIVHHRPPRKVLLPSCRQCMLSVLFVLTDSNDQTLG